MQEVCGSRLVPCSLLIVAPELSTWLTNQKWAFLYALDSLFDLINYHE